MARFVFPLQSLLKHRERVEQERQRDVAVVGAELVAAQTALAESEQAAKDALDDLRANHLSGRIDLNYLAAHRRFMLAMQRRQADLAQRAKVAQAKVDAARQLLGEAVKQRRAIETLRDQQRAAWADAQGRREAAALDEVVTQMSYPGTDAGGAEAETSS